MVVEFEAGALDSQISLGRLQIALQTVVAGYAKAFRHLIEMSSLKYQ